ncbi:MAG: hypothetical protein IGS39_14895 [Calothrix sp. C42_A2020_038]|nr:hypothetical protein [Calothrix sp. C42_A2020_038]
MSHHSIKQQVLREEIFPSNFPDLLFSLYYKALRPFEYWRNLGSFVCLT